MTFLEFKEQYEHKKVKEYPNSVPNNVLVSVCVQAYQHAEYIRECLDSILMQETNFPFEILLGEDCSTDGTREICIEYADKYPEKIRLFLHHRENNIKIGGKPTGRFNFLHNLLFSNSKYIAVCEGDDYWTDNYKLQKQVEFLEENKQFIATSHHRHIKTGNKLVPQEGKSVSFTQCLLFHSYITKEEILNEKVFNFDTLLHYALLTKGELKIMDFYGAVYRYSGDGIYSSLDKERQLKNGIHSFEVILKNLEKQPSSERTNHLYKKIKQTQENYKFQLVSTLIEEKKIKEGLRLYKNYFNLFSLRISVIKNHFRIISRFF